ncbi:hypothetical protein [Streptomyces sp. ML-6]|uniref:hypothetical protein n=1 Tax=Streptomyces sp. ML-6 TaxID=2982693 RepID=UPI0024BF3CAC|nr:hypothetical protein [Streptomyces sp. ML-6]MDK0521259.1 hypothetical protein [Streptomyces sp. ML-6]
MAEVHQEHGWAERLTEGVIVAVVLGLSSFLLAGPVMVFGTTVWQSSTETGTTAAGQFLVPVVFLALTVLPLVLACRVFRSGLRKGKRRLTAAVPAALTLLGGSMVLFAVLCLLFVYAD